MHIGGDDRTPIVIDENAPVAAKLRPYHILAVVPTIGLLGGVPWANRVEPYILGLPFLLFWVVMWVLATSAIMALITMLDARHDDADEVRAASAARMATDSTVSTTTTTTAARRPTA